MPILKIIYKSIFTIILIVSFQNSQAQNKTLIKYYDSIWSPAPKEAAFYYSEFVPNGNVYQVTSYWMQSKKLFGKSTSADTSFITFFGPLVRYYETGIKKDSSFFYDDGILKTQLHYYPNGKLWASYSYDKKTKRQVDKGYDENGKPITDFIVLKDAEFPTGSEGWIKFLTANLKTKVPIKNGAPKGRYDVIIKFLVNEKGEITDIEPETSLGFGMEEEVIRVIKKSPKWVPATVLGKKENAFRRQPITFVVEDK